jgi:UPF0716 family protein affecting phage T7 exclusion
VYPLRPHLDQFVDPVVAAFPVVPAALVVVVTPVVGVPAAAVVMVAAAGAGLERLVKTTAARSPRTTTATPAAVSQARSPQRPAGVQQHG